VRHALVDQQRDVLSLPPSAFDNDRGVWALVRTELYELRGDSARALAYADSARLALAAQSRAAPEDAQRHAILGVALAYLGRKAEAIREGRRGAELLPISQDEEALARDKVRYIGDLVAAVAADDEHIAKGRASLSNTNDEYLLTTKWNLKAGGQVVLSDPRHIVLRDTLNHLAHHRGQLTVYLRLLNQPVPAVYGPSADDQRFL